MAFPLNMKTKSTPAPGDHLPAGAAPTIAAPAIDEEPINILIVDDEPKNLTVLETVLDDPSYRLIRAQSAEQALLALVSEEFALLILDIQMPGMTGFELAQMIKDRKKTACVPIIFLTAYYNEDQHVLEGYGNGAVDYLHKPVNAAILRSKVAVFAELHRKGRQYQQVNSTLLAEVTQRRRAEQQLRELNQSLEQRVTERTKVLRESEGRLQALVTASSDVVYRMSADWTLLHPFDGRNFIPSTSEPTGDWLTKNIHPDDRSKVVAAIEQAIRSKGVFELEHRVLRLDGTWGWTFSRAVPLLDAAGEIIEWFGAASDVTDRKQAEEALRVSEDRFRAAVGAVSDIIWTNNAQGKMEGEQPVWGEFTGQSQEDYVGFGWSKAVHPEDAQPTLNAWNLAVAENRLFEFEHRVRRHDGQWRVCSVRAAPVLDSEGRIREWVGVHTDITERKAAQQELSRHRENLQRAVEERTAELAASTVALHTAERLAALGTLAAGLGHDIANLTMPIRARLQMLEAACTTDDTREDFAAISKSLNHLSNLSAGMRLMAMDPERVEASTSATDLRAWCAQTSPVLRAALPRHLLLECQTPRGLGVKIPQHRLAQAVFNLVQNAGEAMAAQPTGTVRIIAEAATTAAGPPMVRVLVSDDGPGMPAEVVARCFEPYFSTKGRAIATGMGLGMVRGIVESANGTVAVQSAPGEGTTFTLTLPAADSNPLANTGVPRTAAVTIKSERESSLAMMFLGQLAFKTHRHLDSSVPDTSLWVVEKPDPSLVRKYLDLHPEGRIVILDSGQEMGHGADHGVAHIAGHGAGQTAGLVGRGDRMTVLSPSPSPGALRDAITNASKAIATTASEQ